MAKIHQKDATAGHDDRREERGGQELGSVERRMGSELLSFFSVSRRRIPGLEPEDLAQMTLVRVYRSMETFRHQATVRTWVLKIAVNVWSSAVRDRKAQKRDAEEVSLDSRRHEDDGQLLVEPSDPRDDPQQQLLAKERTQLLYEAMEALPKKMKRCMLLRFRDQLSIQEIATLLHIEESTVKSHIQEGNRRLRPLLRDRFDLPDAPKLVSKAP